MARIAFVWELGAGMGHVGNLLPLVQRLSSRGHRLFAIVKDRARAEEILRPFGVEIVETPKCAISVPGYVETPASFAQILHNLGFGDAAILRLITRNWRILMEAIDPDICVFDHSPTGLLASYYGRFRRVLVGAGFFTPLKTDKLPDLRPWRPSNPESLWKYERVVLDNVNSLLEEWGVSPLAYLSELFYRVDRSYLTTFPELDHYGARDDGRYVGTWTDLKGERPDWGLEGDPRVFAYLKPFDGLPDLLRLLEQFALKTIIVCDGIAQELQVKHSSRLLRFLNCPLDIQEVAKTCDFAILNGNHATTIALLLAGKPALQIPITLEQVLFTLRTVALGAGVGATQNRAVEFPAAITRMLNDSSLRIAAAQFALNHQAFDATLEMNRVVDEIGGLLPI